MSFQRRYVWMSLGCNDLIKKTHRNSLQYSSVFPLRGVEDYLKVRQAAAVTDLQN
jgi:hypothetical protein